jgi:hypothetical protein
MPWSNILAYNTASGMNGNPDSISLFYSPVGFAVTGTDQYSIVFGLYDIDASKTGNQQHIVEARYSGGTWTLSKVADFFSGWYDYEGGGSPSNQMDNEIQVARTADGTRLVAKWAQLFNYTFEQDIDGDGDSPDTLTTADILTSVSNVGSGVWSDPANVTESAIHDRLSWIPTPVVPNDLTNLPLLTVASRPADDETTVAAQLLASQLWVAERTQLVLISNVDATASSGAAPIAGESVGSRIASIVPNPTTGSARVTLDVARAGNGSVEIWSSLGERVATLASGTLPAGTQSFTLDGVELPLGAYYVAMKIDGRTVTMPFSVVR